MKTDVHRAPGLDDIRGNIVNGVLIALSIVAAPALVASLWRIQSIGWQPVMAVHLVGASAIWITSIFRQRLAYRVRAVSIVTIIFLIGLGGFLNFALSGAGHPFFIGAVVFATVFLGARVGTGTLLFCLILIAIVGAAYSFGGLELRFDADLYNVQVQSWITTIFAFLFLGGTAVVTISGLNGSLLRSVTDLEDHRTDLENQVALRTRELMDEVEERQQIENSLRQTQEVLREAKEEAEAANNAKSRFLASASHDLRQPLQSATLYVDLLRDLDSDEKRLEIIEKSSASLKATTDIINALLNISQLDADLIVPKKTDIRLGDILNRVADVEVIAQSKGLDFRAVDCSLLVHTDPALLETVIRNLLNNAIKYTETGRVLLGTRRSAQSVWIEIWDTGSGIVDGQLAAVFEEFYQIDNPQRDRQLGLGLGLSIVQRLTKLLGGEVSVRSTVGQGSVFSVRLPIIAAR